jgi:hypothetical protein
MVEKRTKHDVCKTEQIVFVGDDTGLLKRVKVNIKREADTFTVEYRERDPDEDLSITVKNKRTKEMITKRRLGVLTPADN